ncbi:MAG: hypothetical protein ACLRFE_00880 [Clostridia bacterium]
MQKRINRLYSSSAKKALEFEKGVELEGIEYLRKVNAEVNTFIKQNNIKAKDYVKVQKQQVKKDKNNG